MKNNKGFTLVELLAVISILAIIMIIAVPAVQNAFYKAKAGISKINENNLKEAGKTVATEIMYCDPSDKDLITFLKTESSNNITDCGKAKTKLYSTEGIDLKLQDLIEAGYFDDTSKNCTSPNGKGLNIKADNTNEVITVTLDPDITCKK
jgi:type IV pilus assembly protein PilA